ncbi:MAG: penicillin-binding transpeptidase domain-containing protein [Acidobacteriota bacterium]
MIRYRLCVLFYMFWFVAISSAGAADPKPVDVTKLFAGREGCFVLRDLGGSEIAQWGTLCNQAFSPCSTFKIPNALIGLDSGVLESEQHIFKYDGKPRRRDAWNKEMDLREAMRVSCVPCFQELARGIGVARMQAALNTFEYGNRDISGGIDRFWLSSTLSITPQQQVEFLARLWTDSLGVKPAAAETTRRILAQESGQGWQWSGKTGSCSVEDRSVPDHGWFVGEVEHDGRRAVFATLIRGNGTDGRQARAMTQQILLTLHWLPEESATATTASPAPAPK